MLFGNRRVSEESHMFCRARATVSKSESPAIAVTQQLLQNDRGYWSLEHTVNCGRQMNEEYPGTPARGTRNETFN